MTDMTWFQKLRRYIIINTAESYYTKMARQCVELHKQTRQHHYIIIDPWLGKKITITNRAQFRAIKRAINDSGTRMMVKDRYDNTRKLSDAQFQISDFEKRIRELKRDPEKNSEAIRVLQEQIEAQKKHYAEAKERLKNAEVIFTDSSMPDVHSGCFYSSMLQSDLEKLQRNPVGNERAIHKMENVIEARRRAYIKWTLEHAKIRQRKTRQQRREERIIRKELRAIKKGRKK